MNVSFILVLSIIIQLVFSYTLRLLFPSLTNAAWFTYLSISVSSILSIYLPSHLYLKNEKKSYFTDCFKDVKFDKLLFLAAAIGLCAQFAGTVVNLPVNMLIFKLQGEILDKIPKISTFASFLTAIVTLCLLPAVFEEVLFRGIVFNYFRQFGVKSAIVISAFLFSIMHFEIGNLFGTFLLGIIFGLLIKYTNRIVYSMIAHFFVNFFATLIKYLTTFSLFENLYNDFVLIFMITSIPLLIYLLSVFKESATQHDYHDKDKFEFVTEKVIKINEESSIKIFEHDIRENNLKLAFLNLFKTPYIYILIILFIYLGGGSLWGK